MNIVIAIGLAVVAVLGWLTQLVGLPGNWVVVVAAALYAWSFPGDDRLAISWSTVAALFVLAVLGEVIEFVAGAMGVTKAGGSRRGALLALVGSLVGGMIGLVVGVPIPVVGSLAAAILFGGLGALIGAFIGESWKGNDFDTSLQIGRAAFVGRVLGTLGKLIAGAVMLVVLLAALVL
jgi:uncharacterized protein YqgC (DUF456 family)